MEFRKYMHVERYGNVEVKGIEFGTCYIFPKLDGTNSSVWINDEVVQGGSRNRHLSLEKDNAGFLKYASEDKDIFRLLYYDKNLRLYGEWLVPHTIKTYAEDAWRKFYIFDVWNEEEARYLHYDEYQPLMEEYNLNYIPPICVIKNANYSNLINELENNTFLVKDGQGIGEGIVIKNYEYENQWNNTIWAKLVTNQFKAEATKNHGPNNKLAKAMVEQEIVDTYITKEFVEKEFAKIANEEEGWTSKYIPRLLSTVYYELINEELWNIIKKMKQPIINFKTLNILVIMKIKEVKSSIF